MLCNKSVDVRFFLVATLVVFASVFLFKDLSMLKHSYARELGLPEPNQILKLTGNYSFPEIRGMRFDLNNAESIEFIVDKNNNRVLGQEESKQLIDYFLAALSFSSADFWVNFSPYEKDRIIDDSLAQTKIGKLLLEQDYILKQLSASMTSPETVLGKEFWAETKSRDAFNKVWIVPAKASLIEDNNIIWIEQSQLKVMSEADYLAQQRVASAKYKQNNDGLLKKLTTAVNEDKNFAQLRQLYSVILIANWFKSKLSDQELSKLINSKSTASLELVDSELKDKVYSLYLNSLNNGVYDIYSKEDKRKYFSGGLVLNPTFNLEQGELESKFKRMPGQALMKVALNRQGFSSSAVLKINEGIGRQLSYIYKEMFPTPEDKKGFNFHLFSDLDNLYNNRVPTKVFFENLIWDTSPFVEAQQELLIVDEVESTSYYKNLLKFLHCYLIAKYGLPAKLETLLLNHFSGRIDALTYQQGIDSLNQLEMDQVNTFFADVKLEYEKTKAYIKTHLIVLSDILSLVNYAKTQSSDEIHSILSMKGKRRAILKYLRGQYSIFKTKSETLPHDYTDKSKNNLEIMKEGINTFVALKTAFYKSDKENSPYEVFDFILQSLKTNKVAPDKVGSKYRDWLNYAVEEIQKPPKTERDEDEEFFRRLKFWPILQEAALKTDLPKVIALSIYEEFRSRNVDSAAREVLETAVYKLISHQEIDLNDFMLDIARAGKVDGQIVVQIKDKTLKETQDLLASSALSTSEKINGGIDLDLGISQKDFPRLSAAEIPIYKAKIEIEQ